MSKYAVLVLALVLSLISVVYASSICDNALCESQVNASLEKEFTISLPSTPSTGFDWWMKFDTEYLSLVNAIYVTNENSSMMAGVPGQDIFTFTAKKPGNTEVTMLYLQPWDNGTIGERKIFPVVISSPLSSTSPSSSPSTTSPTSQKSTNVGVLNVGSRVATAVSSSSSFKDPKTFGAFN